MRLGERDRIAGLGGGTHEREGLGHAAPSVRRLAQAGHDDVDGVLRHFAVGGELPAGHRHHAVAGRADRVAA